MIQLGIISDTHGLLRPEVVERLGSCDAILHAGDVNRPEILDALRAIAPLYVRRASGRLVCSGLGERKLRRSKIM